MYICVHVPRHKCRGRYMCMYVNINTHITDMHKHIYAHTCLAKNWYTNAKIHTSCICGYIHAYVCDMFIYGCAYHVCIHVCNMCLYVHI